MASTDVRQEWETLAREFEMAFNSGDIDALGEVYAEAATVLPPEMQPVHGRQAIKQFWQAAREQMGVQQVRLEPQQVEVSGDAAFEIGTATLTVQPPEGGPITLTAKYLVSWKREPGGRWQIAADMWNTNEPAQTAQNTAY